MLYLITILWTSSNDTILSQLSILLPFCDTFVTTYNNTTETIQRRQSQLSYQGILQWDQKGHYCHWIDECLLEHCGSVISNDNWCMWVFYSCTLTVGLKPRVFVKIVLFEFLYLPIGFKLRFQSQTEWFILSYKVVTRKKTHFSVKKIFMEELWRTLSLHRILVY